MQVTYLTATLVILPNMTPRPSMHADDVGKAQHYLSQAVRDIIVPATVDNRGHRGGPFDVMPYTNGTIVTLRVCMCDWHKHNASLILD